MLANSLNHYPLITYQGDEKLLWNPISKKAFKNLPEERVRLSFVDYLIEQARFSKNRIAFESAVHLPKDKTKSRTDLICYNSDFNPLLLVECKAPEIRLDAKVALQIARYNQKVCASFLLVTNGISDYWFTKNDSALTFLDVVPEPFKSSTQLVRKYEYWSKRGFAGKNSHPDSRNWILESCSELYNSELSLPKYFSFEGTSPELCLSNYYRIYPIDENPKIALALTSSPYGATKLNAVLNHDGENVALLSVSLDLIASEEQKNTILQTANGMDHLDLKSEIGFSFDQPLSSYSKALSDLML
ncbi:MAG: type I restriction enzyme HsdR N-terminal domain-containing protein [Balneolaceae bacterium]